MIKGILLLFSRVKLIPVWVWCPGIPVFLCAALLFYCLLPWPKPSNLNYSSSAAYDKKISENDYDKDTEIMQLKTEIISKNAEILSGLASAEENNKHFRDMEIYLIKKGWTSVQITSLRERWLLPQRAFEQGYREKE